MNPLSGFPLLTLIVFLPALGAVLYLLVPQERREASRWVVILIEATDLILVLLLYMGWTDDPTGSAHFVDGPWIWIADLGMGYHLAVDGINLHLILLTTLITPLAMAFSWVRAPETATHRAETFWTLLFQTALLGALAAFDLALLSIFWVTTMVAAFFVASNRHTPSQAPSLFLVIAALVAIALLATAIGIALYGSSFDLGSLFSTSFGWQAQAWMFWALTLACGITGAIFPLHLWYPPAQRQAPAATQVVVGSLLLNLGGYALIRLCLLLFPLATINFAPAIVMLGTVGILYAAVAALGQETLSDTLAYWNVAQMGLVAIGVFSLGNLGLHGTVLHMAGCSLATALLRLLDGGRPEDRDQHREGGPVQWWPRAMLGLGLLSALGFPGLLGFAGNSALVLGIMRWRWNTDGSAGSGVWEWIWYVAILLGLLLAAWSLLRATWRTLLPAVDQVQPQRTMLLVPLAIILVIAGLRPSLATDITGPTAHRLLVELRSGVERDLLEMGLPALPGEDEERPPTAPDEGESATWLPTWVQMPKLGTPQFRGQSLDGRVGGT
jgi:NADH-quinone oxidoreductase subunit M